MFFIKYGSPDRVKIPWVNYLLISANVLVFIILQRLGTNTDVTYSYATVPAEILTGNDVVTTLVTADDPLSGQALQLPALGITKLPVLLTLLTSMFLHSGWLQLIGNMICLWILGNSLEQRFGHARYFFFYLLCGIIAGLAYVFSVYYADENVLLASLGTSGVLAGIMGGYLASSNYGHVRVPLIFTSFTLPSFIIIMSWIFLQAIIGFTSGSEFSGIAYAAPVAGFFTGLLLIKGFNFRPAWIRQKQPSHTWHQHR